MDDTRRFRIPLMPVLLLLVAAAVAANIPVSWFTAPSPEDRRAVVFSDFVNLTAEPGQGPLGLMDTVAALSGQQARVRRDRRARIHPAVLDAYADLIGMPRDWLRGAVLDPAYHHPFDISRFEVTQPRFGRYGTGATWDWGLASHGTQNIAPGDAVLSWCDRWLVIWDDAQWFYAPVGTQALNAMLLTAVPELADLPLAEFEGCDVDE